MKSIFVCNTAGNSISEVSLKDYSVENYPLDLGESPVGPHGICYCNENIITANNYNNSISIFSLLDKKEKATIYVGAHPNDVKVYMDKAYVVCGESNSLSIIDLQEKKIIMDMEVGSYPHSIEIDEQSNRAYVCNMEGQSVSIIDCVSNVIVSNIKAPEYPTEVLLSKDKKMIYICESYLGKDRDGYISIYSTSNLNEIGRIKISGTPVNVWEEQEKLYITNFNEGFLSIIDINKGREIKKIFIGGMPRSILKVGEDIFITDYINGKLIKLNLKSKTIKTITVGREPNAMILL